MNRQIVRAVGAGFAGLVVACGLAGTTSMAAGPSAWSPAARAAGGQAARPGALLWVRRYDGPAHGVDVAAAVAASPGGQTVFVTGASPSKATGSDYATVAYNTVTGRRLWAGRYHGPGHGPDAATAVAVRPDGRTVFVTGSSAGGTTGSDYATLAYSAVTGRRLWASRYDGPAHGADAASALAVSPDGRTVFVTGWSRHTRLAGSDYATVAYSAVTGRRLWASRYHGPGDNSGDQPQAVGVSPDGRKVFVTGWLYCCSWAASVPMGNYYGTVAYSAATGTQLWARLYPKDPRQDYDMAFALAVSRHGDRVIVAGRPDTVAYSFSGRQLWAVRYASEPRAVVMTPAGDKAFVTGPDLVRPGYLTTAYNAATGARIWGRHYSGPPGSRGYDWAFAAATSPDGRTVYVAGISGRFGYATVAYGTATGTQIWASSYSGGNHIPAMTVSPRGTLVFLACTTHGDYTIIAYKT